MRHAPADAFDFGGKDTPGERVEHELRRRVGFDVLQTVFAEIGVDPDVAGIDERQGHLAHGDEFAVRQLQVGDDAVARRSDRGADEVELGLLDGCERLAELGIVGALRAELLLGALELGLGLPDAGLGRLDLRRRLVSTSWKMRETCSRVLSRLA